MILGRVVRLVATGAASGVLIALALMRLVRGLLFGVSPIDPLVLCASTLGLLVTVALLTGFLPARRAAAVDPAAALRAK